MTSSDEVNYYELLDVQADATADQIRSAYRQMVRKTHPDAGGSSGLFRLIQHAYETLSDPAARARYDAQLASNDEPDAGPSTSPPRTDADPAADDHPGNGYQDEYNVRDPGWGTETVFDPAESMAEPPRSRANFIGLVISTSVTTCTGVLLALMLIIRPDLLRPDAAEPDVYSDLVSVWWVTLIAAVVYGLFVWGAVLECDPVEILGLFDFATVFAFLCWAGAYWDIATEAEESRFLWVVAIWVVYRLSLFPTTLLFHRV